MDLAHSAALIDAIKTNASDEILHLLSQGVDPCAYLVNHGRYPTAIHFAVHAKNEDALAVLLNHSDEKSLQGVINTSFSGFDSLLHFAITRLDVPAVALLLKGGADPNLIDMRASGTTPLCAIPTLAETDYRENSPQFEILSLLLKYGADPNLPSKSKETPLHFISHLAACAPDAADLLLGVVSRQSYGWHSSGGCPLFSQTPLATAFRSLCNLLSGAVISGGQLSEITIKRVRRMLKFAVLPLMKNGAVISPDLFSTSFDIVRISLSHAQISLIAWENEHTFLRLLIVARRKSDVDLYSMPFRIHTQFPNYFFDLMQILRNLFPLKLQEMCRNAILKQLPIGPIDRSKGIASLDLPRPLISYLQFEEFDLK